MKDKYEAVIGLEVHAQLKTKTKMFCGCKNEFTNEPNINVCPVCLGHPGSLPVINKKAVELAVKAALALNCKIHKKSVFARKHYFYPDLPKNYQISQYEEPFATDGYLIIEKKDGTKKKIRIRRIHMEEDAGKSIHEEHFSKVDLNRAGVPLIEIVSEPDISDPEEARLYMQKLRDILVWIGVSDGNLEEGSLRCDANVSIKPKGSDKLGTKVEIKNLNSFKFIEKALRYEINRQIEVLSQGGKITQETRLYDSQKDITKTMRSKEEAEDYRYFPDPDLPPLLIDDIWLEEIKASLGELPDEFKERVIKDYKIKPSDADILSRNKTLAYFFEEAAKSYKGEAQKVANLILSDLLGILKEEKMKIEDLKFPASYIGELLNLVDKNVISLKVAKEEVLPEMVKTSESPQTIVEKKGLKQITDVSSIEKIIKQAFENNPKAVKQYKTGDERKKQKAIQFFIGQVMKATKGKANPKLTRELIIKLLNEV